MDTIKELKKTYKEEKLYFLIGLDSLFQLKTWKKIKDLSREIEFVVAQRPGYLDEENIKREIEFLRESYGTKITLIKTPLYEISSTDLRQRIKEDKSLRYLIPEKVIDYIKESDFYKNEH